MASSSGNFTMPRKDLERIQFHYDYILDSVLNPDDLITTLFCKGVLDLDQKTHILNIETGKPIVKKLLDTLMTECGDCYQIFLEALREKRFGPIADTLVNTTCKITNLPDAVAIEGRKGLIFTISGETSGNQPLVFKSSWDPEEAEEYFTLHPKDDELRVHVESDPVFTCKSVTLTVTVNDGISDSLPANLEIVEAEVRVILIGKTGVGKSALGNSILDLSPDTRFMSRSSAASVTCCNSHKHRVREVAGDKCIFKILDTPGLSDTKISQEEITRELAKCIDDLEPGPHIFSFVLPICRVDGHVMETIEQYKDLFGECLKKYGVVIFTNKDALKKTSFTEYYKDAKPEFKDFLEDYCGNRYSLINNEDPHPDVQGILSLMLKTKRNNNGVHYRHAMFEKAKKLYAEKLKKIEDEKTKVERKLKQQLELKEEQAKEFKQQLELNEENEKKLKQQLELKEEQEKIFKQQLELNEENEKKLKQQLELNEGQEKKFKQKLELKEENEKKLKHQLELKEEQEKEFKQLFEQLKEENKNKEREMEWENKQLKEQVQKLQDKSPKLLEELNKQTPSDQETDVNSVINPQPQIAEVEKSKQTVDIRGEDFEISNPSGQEIDLKTATVSQPQIAEVEKLRHTVNIQNIDFVKLCNLLLQDGYLNEKDKEDIVSSETSINTMDTLMDILKQTNNNKAYIIVINHLKSGTSMETASSTQGNFPKHVVILRTHSGCLRTTLADGIKEIARKLNERFVVHDYQLKYILEKAKTQPEDAVSDLIDIMKDSKKNFDAFIRCLNDMGYTELVKKLTDDPTHETMVQADQSDGIKTDNENKVKTDIEVVAKPYTPDTDDTYDHLVIDEENKGMTIPDDETTYQNTMDVESICDTCRDGTLDDVNNLILHNKDLNICDKEGRTPLFHCVASEYQPVEKVKLLVSTGAMLNVKDKDGYSLLHLACRYSKTIDCIYFLLEQGLDKDGRDNLNQTPLFHCVVSRYQPVQKIKFLVSTGARLDVQNYRGQSLLHHACWFSTIDCIKHLLEQGLDKDGRNGDNRTPLFYCVQSDYQQVERMKLLVSTGAMVDVKDKNGRSLLYWARYWGRTECESYLRELGLDK